MTAVALTTRRAGPGDLAAVRGLLEAAGLVTGGLEELVREPHALWVAEAGPGRVVGAVGLERCRDQVLLRSLVVAPGHRGAGIGRALLGLALAGAHSGEVWLLTETAEGWFARAGFVPVPRPEVVGPVAASAQFTSLCPAAATVMRLASPAPPA